MIRVYYPILWWWVSPPPPCLNVLLAKVHFGAIATCVANISRYRITLLFAYSFPTLRAKQRFCEFLLFIYLFTCLFYVRSPKEDAGVSSDLECKFFSFSLIDGYVSLVMDTEAQRR